MYVSVSIREYHRGSPKERFFARVVKGVEPDSCWDWRGSHDRKGYGRIGIERTRVELAHRLSWQIHFGSIPDGMCVLHRCDNPPCTNPRHLFLGTKADNNADMRAKGRDSGTGLFSAARFARTGHPRAKLSREQVDEIRSLYIPRRVTRRELADRFGVSESTVAAILASRIWK